MIWPLLSLWILIYWCSQSIFFSARYKEGEIFCETVDFLLWLSCGKLTLRKILEYCHLCRSYCEKVAVYRRSGVLHPSQDFFYLHRGEQFKDGGWNSSAWRKPPNLSKQINKLSQTTICCFLVEFKPRWWEALEIPVC